MLYQLLLMKHVDAPKSKNAWVHTAVDLPPLIMMGNKKQGLTIPTKIGHFSFLFLLAFR